MTDEDYANGEGGMEITPDPRPLPATCGECHYHMDEFDGEGMCCHPGAPMHSYYANDTPPPDWCPLRKETDEKEG